MRLVSDWLRLLLHAAISPPFSLGENMPTTRSKSWVLTALLLTSLLASCGQNTAVAPSDPSASDTGFNFEQENLGTTQPDASALDDQSSTAAAVPKSLTGQAYQPAYCGDYRYRPLTAHRRGDGSYGYTIEGTVDCGNADKVPKYAYMFVQTLTANAVFALPAKIQHLSGNKYKIWANWDPGEYYLPPHKEVRAHLNLDIEHLNVGHKSFFKDYYSFSFKGVHQQSLPDAGSIEAQQLNPQGLISKYSLSERDSTLLMNKLAASSAASLGLVAVGNYINKYVDTHEVLAKAAAAVGIGLSIYYAHATFKLSNTLAGYINNPTAGFTSVVVTALGIPGVNVPLGFRLEIGPLDQWAIDRISL